MPKTSSKPKSEYAIQTVIERDAPAGGRSVTKRPSSGSPSSPVGSSFTRTMCSACLATLQLGGIHRAEGGHRAATGSVSASVSNSAPPLRSQVATLHLPVRSPILDELAEHSRARRCTSGCCVDFEVVHLDGELPDRARHACPACAKAVRLDAVHSTALGKALVAGELGNRALGSAAPAYPEVAASIGSMLKELPLTQRTPHDHHRSRTSCVDRPAGRSAVRGVAYDLGDVRRVRAWPAMRRGSRARRRRPRSWRRSPSVGSVESRLDGDGDLRAEMAPSW